MNTLDKQQTINYLRNLADNIEDSERETKTELIQTMETERTYKPKVSNEVIAETAKSLGFEIKITMT